MDNYLLTQFLELMEFVDSVKKKKYTQMKAYYQKHSGHETFRQAYYDDLKFEFETIELLERFFNELSEGCPHLFTIAEICGTLKEKRENGQPIEYVQMWIPLVPLVKNLGSGYFINLLKMEEISDE